MKFKVQTDEDEYRLVAESAGELLEGSVVPYGHTSVLSVGEDIYYCTISSADSNVESVEVFHIDEVTETVVAPTEDVDFTDSGEGIALVDTEEEEEED